jgi:large subunit ribosomal protein L9
MKIILRKNVNKLGNIGDVVNVKNGYARNFLFPRELAYLATESALKTIEIEKRKMLSKLAKEREIAEQLAQELSNIQLSIPMKVTDEGSLYASVTNQLIVDKLQDLNFTLDKKQILLDEPLKTLGVFDVKIKVHFDINTNIKVWVINENEA